MGLSSDISAHLSVYSQPEANARDVDLIKVASAEWP